MAQLIHLIYCSVAVQPLSADELTGLLSKAREQNARKGITGILLHSDGSFFQVLEGEAEIVDNLFARIMTDERHRQVTLIIREPIKRRLFDDWTMGHAELSDLEADALLGINDFFNNGDAFLQLSEGRAKKLLAAFRKGRWRERIRDTGDIYTQNWPLDEPVSSDCQDDATAPHELAMNRAAPADFPGRTWYSFAYQPIIHMGKRCIYSYEALIRGLNNEPAGEILQQVSPAEMYYFDETCRVQALELAVYLGLSRRLNLNLLPVSAHTSPTAISSVLAAAERLHVNPEQIVLEILEREIIHDFQGFIATVNEYRGSGLVFAIDDFGSGYSGLNLLAEFQPALIKLDMHLVHGIDRQGPRQAIVRGILRTCQDLGIEIIAEGVERAEEYYWLQSEGIELFQGRLFAGPAFEQLPTSFYLPG